MHRILIILISGFFIFSCASTGKVDEKKEIAHAEKKEGEAFLIQGNYTTALEKFLEAEKTIPDDYYLHYDLGLAYMAKKRYALSVKHFKRSLDLKPNFAPAKNNLGTSYLKLEKWDRAIDCFQEIMEDLLYATPHYPLTNMGWAYLGKKKYSVALKYFRKALEQKPEFINAVHGIATVRIRSGEPEKAVDRLKKELSRHPGVAILHADLARAYGAMHQHAEAEMAWQNVIEFAPAASPLIREAEKHIR